MWKFITEHLVTILWVVIPFAAAFLITTFIRKTARAAGQKSKINAKFIVNAVIALIWLAALALVVSRFEQLSGLATALLSGSGILAVILGLAAQESFSNLFSGLFIAIYKPFNIGDRIRIAGDETAGFVEDINLRHTVIRTYTNVRLIVPNSMIGSAEIENSSYVRGVSYPIEVSVAYEDSEKRHRAQKIMEEVVTGHPKFYDPRTPEAKRAGAPPVRALCVGYEDSGIKLKVLMWTELFQDNAVACSECRMEILDRFEKEGIEIPYNKLVVFSKKDE